MTSASIPSAASVSAAASARSTISRRRDDRDVAAGAHDLGLADLGDLAAVDRALAAVQRLVLEEDDRVVVRDRGAEQRVGRPRGRGRHHAQARQVDEPALERRRVLRPEAAGRTRDDAHGDRHRALAAGHEPVLGELVDDRVAGRREEVGEHDLDDGSEARRGSSRGRRRRTRSRRSGVVRTRSGPNASMSPLLVLNTPPSAPTSSPIRSTVASLVIASWSAALIASR